MGKPDSSRKSKSLFNLLKWHSAHEKRSDVDGVGSVGAIEARVTERAGWVALICLLVAEWGRGPVWIGLLV